MKPLSFLYLSLTAVALFSFSSCRRSASPSSVSKTSTAGLCFRDTLHNFGVIPLSQPMDSFDFVFRNTGQGRLVVLGVETSCHCTKASYPHIPIEPGKESFIRVIYDGRGRQAEYFNKSVRVITNASEEPVTLNICGNLH